jgi:hypothetical protein
MYKKPIKRKFLAAAIGLTWLVAVGTGTFLLMAYANTPGKAGAVSVHWPEASRVSRDKAKPTLIMFMHPHCPCSRASVGELALLMAHCQGRVDAHVLFVQPPGMTTDWVETDTWRSASQIPGVTVARDGNEREAQLFGVETSGDTVLYDSQGRLLFHGGIGVRMLVVRVQDGNGELKSAYGNCVIRY